ncbi:MAG: PRD domain-containing protein [Tissierellaceae bacterium]
MNKRQISLLKKLIVQEDYQPIKYFSKELDISGKTVSKDLDEIEDSIYSIGARVDRKQGMGIKLFYTPSQLDDLNNMLNNTNVFEGDKGLEHRRIQILLSLLMNTNRYTTIQRLSDKYIVSRTSINNDLNEIQEKLDKYGLELSRTVRGTKILGSEINIRKALVSTIQEYGKFHPDYIVEYQNIRHRELKNMGKNTILDEKSIIFFENLLNKLESDLKLVIYEPYYTNLLTHLVIMTNRIISGNCIDDQSEENDVILVTNKKLYHSAIYLIDEIEKKFNIKINTEEIIYIYKYLTSIGLSYDGNREKERGCNLPHVKFTRDLIDIVSQMSDIDYSLRTNLYDRLSLHIKPMLNRAKYNIQIKNPLLKDFLGEFQEEFSVVKLACFLVCNRHEVNMISDHEVAYILSYFISEGERSVEDIKIKTVVICHSGYGTSQLLATRLEKSFSNIEVVDIISSNFINNIDLSKIDLIVSTVPLDIEETYFTVSAFLNEIDKKNIENHMESIFRNRRALSFPEEIEKIPVESIEGNRDIEEFNSALNRDNLLHIKDNIYIYPVENRKNFTKKTIIEEKEYRKYIYSIDYSSYRYLSKTLRQIIRENIGEENLDED